MTKDIDAKEADVEAHRKFNLKAMGLVATHARNATKSVAVKTTEETTKPKAAAPKLGAGDDWMKSTNVMKYNIDADPMTKDIDAKEADVEAHRKFNLKAMGLVATHARNATKSVAVKTVEETTKSKAAAPKLGAGDDWMKSTNVMKYIIDAV